MRTTLSGIVLAPANPETQFPLTIIKSLESYKCTWPELG